MSDTEPTEPTKEIADALAWQEQGLIEGFRKELVRLEEAVADVVRMQEKTLATVRTMHEQGLSHISVEIDLIRPELKRVMREIFEINTLLGAAEFAKRRKAKRKVKTKAKRRAR